MPYTSGAQHHSHSLQLALLPRGPVGPRAAYQSTRVRMEHVDAEADAPSCGAPSTRAYSRCSLQPASCSGSGEGRGRRKKKAPVRSALSGTEP